MSFTENTCGTDTGGLSQSLDTCRHHRPDRPATRAGLRRLTSVSRALNERNGALPSCSNPPDDVTSILSERSQQLNTLILDANDLVGVLSERRWAIMELLAQTPQWRPRPRAGPRQRTTGTGSGRWTAECVTAVLERNRDKYRQRRCPVWPRSHLETVASGPYYSAYIPNLDLAQALQQLSTTPAFRRAEPTPGNRPTTPDPAPNCPSPTTDPQGPH